MVLPHDVLLTVLLKQPARSAIKMLMVCPSIHKKVPNLAEKFQKEHEDATTILVADLDNSNNWCLDSWNLANAKLERLLARITISKTDSYSSNLVWAYDSGILCVYETDSGCLRLCNPASGQSKALPLPPFLRYIGPHHESMSPTIFYLSGAPVTSMASNYKLLAVSVTSMQPNLKSVK